MEQRSEVGDQRSVAKSAMKAHSRRAQGARRRQRMCDTKVRYPSAQAAYQKGNDIYLCKHCRNWHRTGAVAQLAAKLMRRFP